MILVSDATYLDSTNSNAETACGDANAHCVGNWEGCGGEDGAKQFFSTTDCCKEDTICPQGMAYVSDATYLDSTNSNAETACSDANAHCVGNWEGCGGEDGAKQFFGATDCCQGSKLNG